MGYEAFIDWISPQMAIAYLLATTVMLTGVLQWAGALWDRPELRLLPSRSATLALGTALVLITGLLFFFGMRRLILVPGLAGTELLVLFTVAAILARLLTALLGQAMARRAVLASTAPATTSVPVGTTARATPTADVAVASAVPLGADFTATADAPLPDDAAWHPDARRLGGTTTSDHAMQSAGVVVAGTAAEPLPMSTALPEFEAGSDDDDFVRLPSIGSSVDDAGESGATFAEVRGGPDDEPDSLPASGTTYAGPTAAPTSEESRA